jgi:hypothetical protein
MTAAAGDALSHLHRRRSSTLFLTILPTRIQPPSRSEYQVRWVTDEDNRSGLKCIGPMSPLAGTVEGPNHSTIALLAETSSKQTMTLFNNISK